MVKQEMLQSMSGKLMLSVLVDSSVESDVEKSHSTPKRNFPSERRLTPPSASNKQRCGQQKNCHENKRGLPRVQQLQQCHHSVRQ
jgi:hypothetical protein